MRFLCLVSFEPQTLAALSPTEQAALNRNSLAYNDELSRKNHYLAAEALEPVSSVRTVRVRHGKTSAVSGNRVLVRCFCKRSTRLLPGRREPLKLITGSSRESGLTVSGLGAAAS
jgi:hypothetical protein